MVGRFTVGGTVRYGNKVREGRNILVQFICLVETAHVTVHEGDWS